MFLICSIARRVLRHHILGSRMHGDKPLIQVIVGLLILGGFGLLEVNYGYVKESITCYFGRYDPLKFGCD